MEFPANELVAVVGALAGAWLGHELGYRRAVAQKVWDRRREAYGTILHELAKAEKVCDAADEYIQENVVRYFESDDYRRHDRLIAEHMSAASNRYSSDYLVLSPEFIQIYEALNNDLQSFDELPPEVRERFAGALRKGRPKLLAQARKEILEDRRRWTWFC